MSKRQRTQLHDVAMHGLESMLDALIQLGDDVNARDMNGWTPLHAAALNGHATICIALLDAGADPHALTDTGHTALDKANQRTDARCAAVLKAAMEGTLVKDVPPPEVTP